MSPAGCPRCRVPRTGVTAFYNTIPRTAIFCALIVILSRRACGVSKNLTRLPKNGRNAIMPAYLYTNSIVPLPDPSTSSLAFARLSARNDRVGGVSPLPCSAGRRYCIILPVARPAACRRCRAALRMTGSIKILSAVEKFNAALAAGYARSNCLQVNFSTARGFNRA